MGFFDGFAETTADGADGVRLRVRAGGEGPPVVLLHGHPRTHTTWHRVAPLLAAAGLGPPAGGRGVLPLRGGGRVDSGHHMAEEAPEELVAALVPFLACDATGR